MAKVCKIQPPLVCNLRSPPTPLLLPLPGRFQNDLRQATRESKDRGRSPLPVRPQAHPHSTVEVRVGAGQGLVAEGNCVAAMRGGEQPEANWRSAG